MTRPRRSATAALLVLVVGTWMPPLPAAAGETVCAHGCERGRCRCGAPAGHGEHGGHGGHTGHDGHAARADSHSHGRMTTDRCLLRSPSDPGQLPDRRASIDRGETSRGLLSGDPLDREPEAGAALASFSSAAASSRGPRPPTPPPRSTRFV